MVSACIIMYKCTHMHACCSSSSIVQGVCTLYNVSTIVDNKNLMFRCRSTMVIKCSALVHCSIDSIVQGLETSAYLRVSTDSHY